MTHRIKGCLPDLLDQLIFRQRRLEGFHLVALGRENVPSGLVDILQQQDLDVLRVEGLEDLGHAPPGQQAAETRRGRLQRRGGRGGKILAPAGDDGSRGRGAGVDIASGRHGDGWLRVVVCVSVVSWVVRSLEILGLFISTTGASTTR